MSLKYEKPFIVPLNSTEDDIGLGVCKVGQSDIGLCKDGIRAGGQCNIGTSANLGCGVGNTP